jgi:hypothetical protein
VFEKRVLRRILDLERRYKGSGEEAYELFSSEKY